ncbi:MAG: ABC transporter permease [Bryobacteraceae bacterium]|nr:ABC transporter permease [Bryobacteraceae bacterium]
MTISLAGRPDYTGERRDAFYAQIQEAVRTIPAVVSAGMVNHLPVGGDTWGTRVAAEGAALARPGEEFGAVIRVSMPGYFQAMNIPLVRGRDFNSGDRPDGTKVVIVNEKLARHMWPGQDPVGKRLTLDNPGSKPDWMTVAGVIRDVRQNDLVVDAAPELYVPYLQSDGSRNTASPARAYMTLVARTSAPPMQLAGAVRGAVAAIDKDVAVAQVRSADRILDAMLWQARMTTAVTGVFAVFALLLASFGIYGVMTFVAGSRSREIGIRVALGADRVSVVALFLRHGLALVGSGIAIGLVVSVVALRALSTVVYGVSATDSLSLAAAPAVLLGVGMAAVLLPALRASAADPASSLRAT